MRSLLSLAIMPALSSLRLFPAPFFRALAFLIHCRISVYKLYMTRPLRGLHRGLIDFMEAAFSAFSIQNEKLGRIKVRCSDRPLLKLLCARVESFHYFLELLFLFQSCKSSSSVVEEAIFPRSSFTPSLLSFRASAHTFSASGIVKLIF